jgi:hypothetical protein
MLRRGCGLNIEKVVGTEFGLCNGYSCHTSLIFPESLFDMIFPHLLSVFRYSIDCGSLTATLTVSHLQIIPTATEDNISPWPISSGTGTPGKAQSTTHLLAMNLVAET